MFELLETGQYDQALENIKWLMDKVGMMPDLEVKTADVLSRAGRAAEAIVHYENAIRMQPNYLEATIKLGTHYLRLQRYALAAEQFNRAVEINDDIVDAYVGLAIAQEMAGQSEETYRTLSLAAAIQQNSTLLFSETATLHLQSILHEKELSNDDQPDKVVLIEDVIRAHQKMLADAPKCADCHYKFGILMMVIGDIQRAVEAFRNALQLNPTYHRARSKLSVCLCETGQERQAIEQLMERESLTPELLEMHYRVAILYCDKQKFAGALYSLDNMMKSNFTQPDALTNIEVVLENLGLVDRAMATWDRLSRAAQTAISERYQQ
jgi:tetratricopeptide (TPR) repeat protein